MKKLLPWKKVSYGYYTYTDSKGREWILEHVTRAEGFAYDEWHCGTEDDPHAGQSATFAEADQSLLNFLAQGN